MKEVKYYDKTSSLVTLHQNEELKSKVKQEVYQSLLEILNAINDLLQRDDEVQVKRGGRRSRTIGRLLIDSFSFVLPRREDLMEKFCRLNSFKGGIGGLWLHRTH